MLYDRFKQHTSLTKLFETNSEIQSNVQISAVEYGPYDNGHILTGLTNGLFIAFDSLNLTKLCQIKICDSPVTSICIEPT